MNPSDFDRKPLVSAIVPVYNRKELLPRALRSVLRQSYGNVEAVVVDDGSTEDIRSVVDEFNDSRITYVRHERNRGAGAARNTAIRSASGEYIAFLDSDDEWLTEKVERQVSHIASRGWRREVSYHPIEVYDEVKSEIVRRSTFRGEGNIFRHMLRGVNVGLIQIIIERNIALELGGFDERFHSHEDWEFLIRLSKSVEFTHLNQFLARGYVHGSPTRRISEDYDRHADDRKLLYRLHREAFEADRIADADYLSEMGYFLAVAGSWAEAQRCLMKSIALNPFRSAPYVRSAWVWADFVRRRGRNQS